MTKMSRLRRRGRRLRGLVLFLLRDGDVLGPELGHRPVEVEHLDPGAPGGGRGEGHRQLVRVAAISHAHPPHLWQICILQQLLYHILTPKLVLRPIVGPVHACAGFFFFSNANAKQDHRIEKIITNCRVRLDPGPRRVPPLPAGQGGPLAHGDGVGPEEAVAVQGGVVDLL